MQVVRAHLAFVFCTLCLVQMPRVASSDDLLNLCLDGKHHKSSPDEGVGFGKQSYCSPWADRSCCTNKTVQSIENDGGITLYNMKWNHCERNLSSACRDWFMKDTCFYECSPNIGAFIVHDRRSRYTRKERVLDVPLCSNDCDSWFEACKDELTCSDNWGKNWKWTKQGNQCIKECKTFAEHFQDSENFCNNIFDRSFVYAHGTPGKDCYSLWPHATSDGVNPNENVAKLAVKSRAHIAAVSPKIVNFLDTCLSTDQHKSKPTPETEITECVPWRSHGCCSKNTVDIIKKNGVPTIYKITENRCGTLSKKCQDYFMKDTCFHSCSPNLAPWIVNKNTNAERISKVPLCSHDCDEWFKACEHDFTCPDNFYETWQWNTTDYACKANCTSFRDYFKNSESFCNTVHNHTYVFTVGEHGEDCMSLWPDSSVRDLNREVAIEAAHNFLSGGDLLNAPKTIYLALICYAILKYIKAV